MNKRIQALLCVLLSCITIFGTLTVANAATDILPLSSDVFDTSRAWLTHVGGGKILIEFQVTSTVTMRKIGVASMVLYEKKPGETSFSIANTYTWANTPNLTASNTPSHYLKLNYTGVPGAQYYATVSFYAETRTGSVEIQNCVTSII